MAVTLDAHPPRLRGHGQGALGPGGAGAGPADALEHAPVVDLGVGHELPGPQRPPVGVDQVRLAVGLEAGRPEEVVGPPGRGGAGAHRRG